MVCDEVRRFVYFFLDDALSESRQHQIETHLECCPGCSQRVLIQRRLRSFLKRRLVFLAAPAQLRSRLTEACRGQVRAI